MLTKFKKQYSTLCESVLGYTIHTIEKNPILVNIDGQDLKLLFKVSELMDTNGEIKSIDPIYETIRLQTIDNIEFNGQDLIIKYNDYIKKCIEDSLNVEQQQSKKDAKKEEHKEIKEMNKIPQKKTGLLVKKTKI